MKKIATKEYVRGIKDQDRILLSQAITLIESTHPEHEKQADELIEEILPLTGKSFRLGITGVPGVGKSTFIENIGEVVIQAGHQLAVLAVDPSSQRSKGSILGDKTRMQELSRNPKAYIRPSPTAGSLGGVTQKTRETILLCEAAGFDVIFVETVGVGQSETVVHSMVDFFLLLMLAGAGDELQGMKRGIMEMADAMAITKADGDNIQASKLAKKEYENAFHLFPTGDANWTPQVLTCSSLQKTGLGEIWQMIQDYKQHVQNNGYFEKKRKKQLEQTLMENIAHLVREDFQKSKAVQKALTKLSPQVLEGKISPFKAAKQIATSYLK